MRGIGSAYARTYEIRLRYFWSHGLRAFYGLRACVYDILTTGSQKSTKTPYGICKAHIKNYRGIVRGMRAHEYGIGGSEQSYDHSCGTVRCLYQPVHVPCVTRAWPVHVAHTEPMQNRCGVHVGTDDGCKGTHISLGLNQMCFIFKLTCV